MWYKKGEDKYEIKIGQLMSGVSKDFLMEVELPGFVNPKIDDNLRNIEVL